MRHHRRRSLWPAPVLCVAALALAAPVAATASPSSERAGERASRIAEREQRAEERRTAREQLRTERQAARAKRHAEREAARAERRAARGHAREDSEGAEGGSQGGSGEGGSVGSQAPSSETPTGSGSASGCSVTIAPSSARVVVGETVTLTGSVSCPSALSAGKRQLAISETAAGSPATATPAATASTAADGSYTITSAALTANTVFRVSLGHSHARTVVKVAPRVTLSGPALSAPTAVGADAAGHGARRRATFTGTVDPFDAGARVGLQIASPSAPGQWRTVSYARVAGDGTFALGHNFRASGQTLVRAVAYGGKHKAGAASEALSYDAPQPQNPQLTIDTSADPASAGQTVTLTGVAAGAPHQTVTLLAHTPGSAPVAVATTTTDEAGDYTFTQAPLEDTYYRVTAATASSTTLYVGVTLAVTADALPNVVSAGEQVTFSGTVSPSTAGRAVRLEQAGPGFGFQVVGTGTVSAESKYAIAYSFAHAGTFTMRVRIAGEGKNLPSGGEPVSVLVSE